VKWHLKAYQWLENNNNKQDKNWRFEVFNLWVWRGLSVLEMIKLVEEIGWKKIPYKIIFRREWDLPEVYCNPSKANKILWWKTETNIKKSIKNMIDFSYKNL